MTPLITYSNPKANAWLNSKRLLIIIFFGLIAIYAIYQTHDILLGPRLFIQDVQNGKTYTEPLITIEGEAKNISHLFLNDRQIFTNEQGQFQEKLLLIPGYSIIKLEAKDKFGRSVKRMLALVYDQSFNN